MQAWTLDDIGSPLTRESLPDPVVRSGGVVLRMVAVQVPAYTRVLVEGGRGGIATPTVLGIGGTAVVEEVADDVTSVRPGETVMCTGFLRSGRTAEPEEVLLGWTGIGGRGASTPTTDRMRSVWRTGTFAERALMPASTVLALPGAEAHPRPEELAFLPWLSVAAGAIERSGIAPGDRVVVLGGSGQMGGAAVLLALARGAARVVAVGRDAGSLERLAAVDPRIRAVRSTGGRSSDAAAIREAAGGDAEVVIDALGAVPTPDLTMAGFDVVRTDGTLVLLGGVRQELPVPYGEVMRRRVTIRGSWMCSEETALRVWRQVQSGVVDLSSLEVTAVGIDDPAAALDRAERSRGLSIVALTF